MVASGELTLQDVLGQLVLDLVLAIMAALVGGAMAQRVGQPPILGYLLGGVVIGPFTPGFVADQLQLSVAQALHFLRVA